MAFDRFMGYIGGAFILVIALVQTLEITGVFVIPTAVDVLLVAFLGLVSVILIASAHSKKVKGV